MFTISKVELPSKLVRFLKKRKITPNEVSKNKNFETILIGCELYYLRDSDISYMLEEGTSEVQATNRLIARRREAG